MLNPFPILFLSMLAHFLLRVAVGFMLLYLGFKHMSSRGPAQHEASASSERIGSYILFSLSLIEIVAGGMFILGLYTQIAALMGIGLSIIFLILHQRIPLSLVPNKMFFTLLLFSCLSLFITGAGAFAFDIPI